MDPQRLIPGDATLIENIMNYLKSKGIFDEFRHECLADVDTKSSCQNLSQRVDGYTSKFLTNETWHSDLNKNELRNKLRRNLDDSGMLAFGADHVVEQVINPKVHQLFLPQIVEVVHQYSKEQNELFNKKHETTSSDNTSSSDKKAHETSDSKAKTSFSDPIADILSFSCSKSKPTPSTSTHGKSDSIQQKHADIPKIEKKKEEKSIPVIEKNTFTDIPKIEKKKEEKSVPVIEKNNFTDIPKIEKKREEKFIPVIEKNTLEPPAENKMQIDEEKEKVKKEDHEISQETSKKVVKEELKPEKKKPEDVKVQSTDTVTVAEKNNQKLKSSSTQKSSSNSNEIKIKKEVSDKPTDKSSEKPPKSKPTKPLKESTSPTKSVSSVKSVSKEEKVGESSKSKSSDPSSNKISESLKKPSKFSSIKKDNISKQKGHSDKTDKSKIIKPSDKSDQNVHSDSTSEKGDKSKIPRSSDKSDQSDSSSKKSDKSKTSKSTEKGDQNTQCDSSNSEKVTKSSHYSSSYDSSQGSDQEKSSSSSSKKERQKHFYKHAKKEKSKEHSDRKTSSDSTSSDRKKPSDSDESHPKKAKSEKSSKLEKLKDPSLVEAAKINSRSNSFGSTSSVSSSSNASKDNLVSNSDEASESSIKDKKKKQVNEKDSCQDPTKVLPPPPPPPPSSTSLLCEPTSADVSSMEDTHSSAANESSSSDAESEESSSDSELESKDSLSNTLNESTLNSSTDNFNDFYDIFLYSSSSSEFEGFEKSPERKEQENVFEEPEVVEQDSDVSVSSVHTSDLSSFDDELSDDDFSFISGSHPTGRRRFTLKEAQELLQNKATLLEKSKNSQNKLSSTPVSLNDGPMQKSSTLVSSDEEVSPSEPKRSLRRERKLNPRYASSEYTSIFNSRKETFITKQSSPSVRSNFQNSSSNNDSKCERKELVLEKSKLPEKACLEAKINEVHQTKQLQKTLTNMHNSESCEEKESSDYSGMSSADEMDSNMNEEIIQENDKTADNSDNNHLKNHLKVKLQNNSKMNMNSCSLKRKLPVSESTPVKRPCSRSSVDSPSSELVPNENKPFNSEKQRIVEDKILRDSSLKGSDLTDGIKKDPFCKQRTNNNGDILGQKDIFPKNSHGKTINIAEKKTNESDASKELNAL